MRRRAGSRLRLRTFLLAGLVIPLAGMTSLTATSISESEAGRRTTARLVEEVAVLDQVVETLVALADEKVYATASLLALENGIQMEGDPAWEEHLEATEVARARVDRQVPMTARGRALLAELTVARNRLEAGQLTSDQLNAVFAAASGGLEEQWRGSLGRIRVATAQRPLSADLRARLRTLSETLEAFAQADARAGAGLALFLGHGGLADGRLLQESTVRFHAAMERTAPVAGSRAEAAWTTFRADPGAVTTEAAMDLAIDMGLGIVPMAPPMPPAAFAQAVREGRDWAVLIADTVRAATDDLEEAAVRQAAADQRAMQLQLGGGAAVAVVALAMVLLIASRVTAPIVDLESSARRIEHGDFAPTAVHPRGPREVTATVHAFNDMAATLSAVELHAVALAENPDDPVHGHPLPGRTGQAMQVTLDRLRDSIRDADRRGRELTDLASHDGLTHLLNRRAAFESADRSLENARRSGQALVALFVDLDGLKHLNDTYGHAVGDAALVATARALHEATRAGDIVARLGGDEFLIIGLDGPDSSAFADRVLAAVSACTVDVGDGRREPVRCSIGVAYSGPSVDSVDALVMSADEALYRAKGAGRGRVVHQPEPTSA